MNFEEAYHKVEAGTATEEEKAYVSGEIAKLSRIRSILDEPVPSDEIREAEESKILKARKRFNHRTTVRIIVITLASLCAVAALVCGIIFIPSLTSAHRNQQLDRDACVTIAEEYLADYADTDPAKLVVRDVDHELRLNRGLNDAYFAYEVRMQTPDGVRYTVEVSSESGYPLLTDINHRD